MQFAGGARISPISASRRIRIGSTPIATSFRGLYRAYKQAADWVAANPAAAAPLVATLKDDAQRQAIIALMRDNSRLALDIKPAGKIAKAIQATYRAGMDVGLFKDMPPDSTIYNGEME